MNALQLLKICEQSGVNLELVDSEHLKIKPIERLPSGLIDQIKQYKTEIIGYLAGRTAANDTPEPTNLTPRQVRALNGFLLMMEQQIHNLINNGYSTHSAMVNTMEWRHKVQRKLNLDGLQMQKIESVLIQQGYIAYASTLKSWLIHGDGQPLPIQQSYLNNDCLHDGTAKGFYHWFNTGETIH